VWGFNLGKKDQIILPAAATHMNSHSLSLSHTHTYFVVFFVEITLEPKVLEEVLLNFITDLVKRMTFSLYNKLIALTTY
jgi:hypothetical protein